MQFQPASKDQIMQIIEKARENLPAKQPKKKPPTSAPATARASAPASSNDYDEPDVPPAKKEKSPSAEPAETKAPAKGPGKTKAKSVRTYKLLNILTRKKLKKILWHKDNCSFLPPSVLIKK